MNHIETSIKTTSDAAIEAVKFSAPTIGTPTDALTMRLYNDDTVATSENLLCLARADFIGVARPLEQDFESVAMGQECVNESWLEARAGTSGAWVPLTYWPSALDLGAIAAGAYATFQVRLNVPAGVASIGLVNFSLAVYSR